LHEQAEALKAEAEKLPYGKEREALQTKARQLELASNAMIFSNHILGLTGHVFFPEAWPARPWSDAPFLRLRPCLSWEETNGRSKEKGRG
jgi:hypothetical protein